jgi:nucleotidyltransferase substrate binding protein (TIGR01987 family)
MQSIDKTVMENKLGEYVNTLDRFKEALDAPKDKHLLYLDAAVHRFIFCYELTWKNLRHFLRLRGIQANSPVMVFRGAFREKWIDDEELFEKMVEDRNIVTHEYFQQKAEAVYSRLAGYYSAMHALHKKMAIFHSEL